MCIGNINSLENHILMWRRSSSNQCWQL